MKFFKVFKKKNEDLPIFYSPHSYVSGSFEDKKVISLEKRHYEVIRKLENQIESLTTENQALRKVAYEVACNACGETFYGKKLDSQTDLKCPTCNKGECFSLTSLDNKKCG